MSDAVMSKTRKVLDLGHRPEEAESFQDVVFSQPDMPTGAMIYLPIQDWIDMGEPGQITVTVEPGDLLNDEEA